MATTKKKPSGERYYAQAFNVYSAYPTTSKIVSIDSVSTTDGKTESVNLVRIFDAKGSYLTGGTLLTFFASNAGAGGANEQSATRTSGSFQNYSQTSKSEEGGGISFNSYASEAVANGGGATGSDAGRSFTRFGSIDNTQSGSFDGTQSNSYSYETEDSDGNTGGATHIGGTTVTSSFSSSSTVITNGTNVSYGRSYYSQSGITQTNNDTTNNNNTASGESPLPTSSSTSFTITPAKISVRTKAITTARGMNHFSTESFGVTSTYSILNANLLGITSSSFPFSSQRSVYDTTETALQTVQAYELESKEITEAMGDTFKVSSIYGASYIVGGSTLDNQVVTGASLVSTFGESKSQNTNLQSYSTEYYRGDSGDETISYFYRYAPSLSESKIIGSSNEETQITLTTSNNGETLDFGRNRNEVEYFTTQTYRNNFLSTTFTNGYPGITSTFSEEDVKSFQFSGYTSATSLKDSFYVGSEGISTLPILDIISKLTTFVTTFARRSTNTAFGQSVTYGASFGFVVPTSPNYNRLTTKTPIFNFVTFDKGKQGGVQYETSTNISGAVRSTRAITIADQVVTTSTMESPAATIDISVNTAISNSYTLSGGFPLGLRLSLNRYLTFFPVDGYGSIYSTVGENTFETWTSKQDQTSHFLLSYDGDSSSFVEFTTTGKYSTSSQRDGSTHRTTQSFASLLRGKVKIQKGAAYAGGKKTRSKVENRSPIYGGQLFTDEEGVLVQDANNPPASFYAFDGNASSLIQQDGSDVNLNKWNNTISLPANSLIFAPTSSYVKAQTANFAGAIVYSPVQR